MNPSLEDAVCRWPRDTHEQRADPPETVTVLQSLVQNRRRVKRTVLAHRVGAELPSNVWVPWAIPAGGECAPSPASGSGGLDRVSSALREHAAELGLKGGFVWHTDQISRMLDDVPVIRQTYAGAPLAAWRAGISALDLPVPAQRRWPNQIELSMHADEIAGGAVGVGALQMVPW